MINPYEAPRAPDAVPRAAPATRVLASPWRRLGGALIDMTLMYAVVLPGALMASKIALGSMDLYRDFLLYMGAPAVLVVLVQSLLISARGQSLGKLALGTRIVRRDGSPAGFLRGVVIRWWLSYLLWVIPSVGSFAAIVDGLMVFRRSRQCAHDMFAGTIVVLAESMDDSE